MFSSPCCLLTCEGRGVKGLPGLDPGEHRTGNGRAGLAKSGGDPVEEGAHICWVHLACSAAGVECSGIFLVTCSTGSYGEQQCCSAACPSTSSHSSEGRASCRASQGLTEPQNVVALRPGQLQSAVALLPRGIRPHSDSPPPYAFWSGARRACTHLPQATLCSWAPPGSRKTQRSRGTAGRVAAAAAHLRPTLPPSL